MNPNTVQNEHITQATMKSNVPNEKEQRGNQTSESFHILKEKTELHGKKQYGKSVGFDGEQ